MSFQNRCCAINDLCFACIIVWRIANICVIFISFVTEERKYRMITVPENLDALLTRRHLLGELFKAMTGVDVFHVPYRGAPPAITDMLGGQIQVLFATVAVAIEHIRAGRLRALGVTTSTRSSPRSTRRALNLGSARAALTSLFSLSIISAGVFLGATRPAQMLAPYPGTDSPTVGISGSSDAWLGPTFDALPLGDRETVIAYMLSTGILHSDNRVLGLGPRAEVTFGRRHFGDLVVSFSSPMLLSVMQGHSELGTVHPLALTSPREGEPLVILLAGRSWKVMPLRRTPAAWLPRSRAIPVTRPH
jgi:hypothetical protein